LPAAAGAAAKHGAAYAFDAEDFHLGDAPETPDTALARRLIQDIESRYLPGASYLTAASPMIADAYAETYKVNQPKVVLNVFPRGHAPLSPMPRGSAVPGPSLYWFSQTIGPGRGIETALEAIARAATAPHLYLRGTPAAGYDHALHELARRHGVADRLHILAPGAPKEMERLGTQYDLGFSGETGFSRNNSWALGNKLFSYLLGGVPIMASDIPSHRAIAPQLGEAMSLFPIGDASALAGLLDRLLLDPARLAAARAHAWRLGQERYCWEVEQHNLVAAVGCALSQLHLIAA
jgi:glycosyltransferase involved in cell wall biosynthesis